MEWRTDLENFLAALGREVLLDVLELVPRLARVAFRGTNGCSGCAHSALPTAYRLSHANSAMRVAYVHRSRCPAYSVSRFSGALLVSVHWRTLQSTRWRVVAQPFPVVPYGRGGRVAVVPQRRTRWLDVPSRELQVLLERINHRCARTHAAARANAHTCVWVRTHERTHAHTHVCGCGCTHPRTVPSASNKRTLTPIDTRRASRDATRVQRIRTALADRHSPTERADRRWARLPWAARVRRTARSRHLCRLRVCRSNERPS